MDCITGQFSHQTWVKKMSTNAEISTKQSSQNLGRLSYILGNKLLVGLLIFTEQGHVDDHLELDNNRGCTVVKSAQSLLLCQLIIAIFMYDDCMKICTQYLGQVVHTYQYVPSTYIAAVLRNFFPKKFWQSPPALKLPAMR